MKHPYHKPKLPSAVLPDLPPIPGLELQDWRDMFTAEELLKMQSELKELAEARRRGTASALASTERY